MATLAELIPMSGSAERLPTSTKHPVSKEPVRNEENMCHPHQHKRHALNSRPNHFCLRVHDSKQDQPYSNYRQYTAAQLNQVAVGIHWLFR